MSNPNRDRLSMSRFKDCDPMTLSNEDYVDYLFAKLMSSLIQRLEGAIVNDRMFNRLKYDVMSIIHATRAQLDGELIEPPAASDVLP